MISYKKIFFVFFVTALFTAPAILVFADGEGDGVSPKIEIENPLGATRDLSALILKVVDGVAQVGYYIVVIFIIYSGFKFVKARGNPKELEDAKQTFLYTVVGAAILLGATLLANVISGTVTELKTSSNVPHISLPASNNV